LAPEMAKTVEVEAELVVADAEAVEATSTGAAMAAPELAASPSLGELSSRLAALERGHEVESQRLDAVAQRIRRLRPRGSMSLAAPVETAGKEWESPPRRSLNLEAAVEFEESQRVVHELQELARSLTLRKEAMEEKGRIGAAHASLEAKLFQLEQQEESLVAAQQGRLEQGNRGGDEPMRTNLQGEVLQAKRLLGVLSGVVVGGGSSPGKEGI